MSKLFFQFLVGLLLIFSWQVNAQEKSFLFEDELCRYEAFYDSTKYSEKQLNDTFKLTQGYFNIYTEDEQQLDDTYKLSKKEILGFQIVKNPYFNTLRDSIVQFLDWTYRIKKIEFAARKGKTKDLLKYFQKNSTVKLYSEALHKGGDDLMEAYEHLTKEQMKNNAAPEVLWNEYVKNSKSGQAQQLAFEQVLSYGWWNAVNHELPHINMDGSQMEEFQKLFSRVKTIDCDEI